MFDKFVTPTVPLYSLNIYLVGHGCNQTHDGVILQLEDENVESIFHDFFNYKYFITHEEYVQALSNQGNFPIDAFKFSIHQEYNMPNRKFDQTSGTKHVFIDTSDDSGVYLPIDVSKPPKFDVPSSEILETC